MTDDAVSRGARRTPRSVNRALQSIVRFARSRGDAAAVIVAAAMIGLPAIVSRDGFTLDFTNHLWLIWAQDHALSAHGQPGYFLHTDTTGAFDPFFMFYGGTLYVVTGALSVVLGESPRIAYVISICACAGAAYGGMLWLARLLGVRSWRAHAPAVAFVAGSAYFVTNIYGRGAWPEFVSMSAIPLLLASGVHIARAARLTILPCALFVMAAVLATGSHNISLLWGTIVLVVVLGALRLALRSPLFAGRRRLAWLAVLVVLAGGVNAWYLLPNVLYAGDTQIANSAAIPWAATAQFNTPRAILDPLRYAAPAGTPALMVQAPVWMLAWALAGLAILWRRVESPLRRALLALAVPLAALLTLILVERVYEALPHVLRLIQFAYRLNTYVDLLICAMVLIAALAIERYAAGRKRTILSAGLVVAMGISVALCVWQLYVPDTHQNAVVYDDLGGALVSPNTTPRSWYSGNAYFDFSAPIVSYPPERLLVVDPIGLSGNSATLTLTPPPGREPFAMLMGAGPEIVRMSGLERLGRTEGGLTVARRLDDGSGPVSVTFSVAGGAIVVGRIVSLVALATLYLLAAGAAGWALARRRRRGRASRAGPSGA